MAEPESRAPEKPPDPGPKDLTAQATGSAYTSGAGWMDKGTPIGYDPRQVNRCRSCNALIWWRVNPSGARQPFDYDARNQMGTDMPHHATCPQGRQWRRDRAGRVPAVADDA